MKVIREGKNTLPVDVIEFECAKCGCVFQCEKDEYFEETTITLTTYPERHYVYASCPYCHKIVRSSKKSQAINNYTINLSDNLNPEYLINPVNTTVWTPKREKKNTKE